MYDVAIIGGGPGGYAAAIRASQLKGKVALIESGDIGGTCVNRGCIPSKTWLHAAELLDRVRQAETFGIKATIDELNLSAVVERINGVAGDIRMGMEGLLGYNKVKVFRGRAVLRNARAIDVEGTAIDAKRIIVATGSRIDMPDVPGLEEAATTTSQIFEMTSIPESVLVWGAGPIEVEMATLLNRFGAEVTLAMTGARILEGEDRDTSQRVAQAIRTAGVEILPKHQLNSVKNTKNGFVCELSSESKKGPEIRSLEVASVLVGARKPNTAYMGLEKAGIDLGPDGAIQADDHLRTSIDGIYAIGDAIGGRMLSHAASAMGITAAENAMGKPSAFPFQLVPRGIWSSPEVGAVGLTEEEAEKQGYEIEVGNFPYTINGLAMVQDQLSGAAKIISDEKYGKILGIHLVGARATELVGEAVLAMELEATVNEFARSLRVHPTFSETMVEASRDAANWALYLQN